MYHARSLTADDVNFLEGLANDMAFVQVPLNPVDEEPERCIECGRYAITIYLGEGYCSWDAAEFLGPLPALAYAGFNPSRRELHAHARRSA